MCCNPSPEESPAIVLYRSPHVPQNLDEAGYHYIGMLLCGEIVTSHHHLWELQAARDMEVLAGRALELTQCGCGSLVFSVLELNAKASRSPTAPDQFRALPLNDQLTTARAYASDLALELEIKQGRASHFNKASKRTVSACRAVNFRLPALISLLHFRNYARVAANEWEEADRRAR